jgi:hypothetical protein
VTVTAPPRPPHPGDPVDRDELEALIEEARRRARRRRRMYGAVAALVVLVGAVFTVIERTVDEESQSAPPSLSAPGLPPATADFKIAFLRGPCCEPGGWALYVTNADGSGEQRLARNSLNAFNPAWSPDGKKIAFQNERDVSFDLYLMNADGTGQRSLTRNSANDGVPAWSPDGQKIAFFRWIASPGPGDIYVMNADGSGQRRLARNATGTTVLLSGHPTVGRSPSHVHTAITATARSTS